MSRRQELIDKIQALSADEGTRQPTAAVWLADQDAKALLHQAEHPEDAGHDYQTDQLNASPEE